MNADLIKFMQQAHPDPQAIEAVRRQFYANGMTVTDWAREHGFDVHLVYSVLNGRSRARRGQSHEIAIALGLKTAEPGVLLNSGRAVEPRSPTESAPAPEEALMKS